MPDAIAQALTQYLAVSGQADGDRGFAAFERQAMPASVGHFLAARLRARLSREARLLTTFRSDWLDTSDPPVIDAVRTLRKAVVASGRFPPDVWSKAVHEAVEYALAYVVRPVKTLCAFAFGDENGAIAAETVRERLGYFRDYPYLLAAARACADCGMVKRSKFAGVLGAAESTTTAEFGPEDWIRLLEPVYSLATHAGVAVSAELLSTFFADKGESAIAATLSRRREPVDRDAMLRVLAPEPETVPLWQRFHMRPRAQPLWMQFREGSDEDDLATAEWDVLGKTGSTRRERFVRTLFDGREDAYADVLGRLRAAPTWLDASGIVVRDVFRAFDINVYDDDAQRFAESVRSRYEAAP